MKTAVTVLIKVIALREITAKRRLKNGQRILHYYFWENNKIWSKKVLCPNDYKSLERQPLFIF